jgi:1,4-dihydroxy-6-naphthoate synthase
LKLSIGFSPCPNDTFIFNDLVNGKLPKSELEFEPVLADVEALNKWAVGGKLDVTKLSVGSIASVSKIYQILDAGSALGFGVGPLLISKKEYPRNPEILNTLKVAIPGKHTTANLLLSLAFPGIADKVEMLFSDIEQAVISGEVDAGLIIHENRFTYQAKGLHKILDLGAYWEETTAMPIPLGCIAIRRTLSEEVKQEVSGRIKKSILAAFENPASAMPYVKLHAQEMNEHVMEQHIDLYVNEFSVSLGQAGRVAVEKLLEAGKNAGLSVEPYQPLFFRPV